MAIGVGFRELRAAAGDRVILQRVLHDGGVVLQRRLESVDQHIGLEVVILDAADLLIGLGITVIGSHADGGQQSIVLGEAVKHFDVLHAVLSLGVGANVCHAEVSKLNAFERIAVGGAVFIQWGQTLGVTEYVFHAVHIADAGGDIGAVPKAVLFGVGQIVFPQVDVAGAGHVNRRLIHRGGEGRDREAAGHHKGQQQGKNSFHAV